MRNILLDAVYKHAEGHVAKHRANVEVYLHQPVGIGEHSDIIEEPEDIQLSLTGIWLRVNDKVNRLKNMLKRKGHNYVVGETMMDSFVDIANYGIIAMLVMRGQWKK